MNTFVFSVDLVCKEEPWSGGTGENTPFAKQSRKKEQDNGHDNFVIFVLVYVDQGLFYTTIKYPLLKVSFQRMHKFISNALTRK